MLSLLNLKKEKKIILAFVLILVLSFSLRFFRVILEKQPIFGDEAIYIRWSQIMRAEPSLRFVPQSDGKQPLFMWFTIPFLKIFDDPLIAGRMLSVYTGVITCAGVFFLTLLLFESGIAALTAETIYAVSPFSVFFDSMALADSMLSMFIIWGMVFAVIAVKKRRLDFAMLSGFSLGGALLTKSPATFFVYLLPLTFLTVKWPKALRKKINYLGIFIFLFSFIYMIAYGLYNILRLGTNFHMIAIRNRDYVYSMFRILDSPWDPFLPFIKRIVEYFWLIGPGILLLLIFAGLYVGTKKRKRETFVVSAFAFIPVLVVAEFSKTMTARYIYFTLPYIFILASLAFIHLVRNNVPKIDMGNKILLLVFVIFIVNSVYIDYRLIMDPQSAKLPRSERSGYFEEWTAGYGIKESAKLILAEYLSNPGQKIVVGTEGYFGTLPDGLQIYLNDLPEITVIGVGIDLNEVPQSLQESYASGNKTYFLINSTRLKGDYKNMDLDLVAFYPKASRKEGTMEYNLHGSREALYLFELTSSSENTEI